MAKHPQAKTAKPQLKKQPQPKRGTVQLATQQPGPAGLPEELLHMPPGSSMADQIARLHDPRLQSAQRQSLAAHVGRVQGNRHLQRMLGATKGKAVQRHWLPGEEEEVQTKSLLQRHPVADEAVQRHWLPGEEEEVQTKLLQRQAWPDKAAVMRQPAIPRRGVARAFGKNNHSEALSTAQAGRWTSPAQAQAGFGKAEVIAAQLGKPEWRLQSIQRQGGAVPDVKDKDDTAVKEDPVKLEPVTFTPGEIPADSKATSQAAVKSTPGGRTIKWELVGEAYGSSITDAGVITAGNDTKGQEKVELQVKATDDKQPSAFSTGRLILWDAKLYQAKQDFPKFIASKHTYPNFTTGLNGKFDVEYDPAANLANIIVKVKFTFPDDENPKPSLANLFGLLGAAEREERLKRHRTYRDNFIQQILAQWSGRYQFKNVREPQSVWGKLNPTNVKVNVVEVDTDQHFIIEVRQKTRGTAQVGGGTAKLFQGNDVPAPNFNPDTAQGELARVNRNTPTPILFDNNSTDIPAADRAKLEFLGTYLSRINNPRFKIDIVGHASATGDQTQNQTLSENRANAVATVLAGAGATQHTINTSGVGQTGANKTDQWRKVDITSSIPVGWQNMQDVTAHEFGHMIGLGDEYAGGGSPTATHYDLVKKAFGQDYADQVAKRGDTDYASIMEGGNDVRIQHYVTFWSGLCETTMKAPVPDPKFGYDDWKFIG